MSAEIAKYYELRLGELEPREKFFIGCRLLDDVAPELSSMPFRVADRLWEKIYQCESLIKQACPAHGGDLATASALLMEVLELIEPYRHDVAIEE
jgi:hypothetical protein